MNYQKPVTRKDLKRFLGLINYDRIFLGEITDLTKPLYKLLEKNKKFDWGEE
jgi:hypothetical protein